MANDAEVPPAAPDAEQPATTADGFRTTPIVAADPQAASQERSAKQIEEFLLPAGGLPILQFEDRGSDPDRFKRRAVLLLYSGGGLLSILGGLSLIAYHDTLGFQGAAPLVVAGLAVGMGILALFAGVAHSLWIKSKAVDTTSGSRNGYDDESGDLRSFDQVARLNQRLIASYHRVTTAQARSSYRNSQMAMGVGLVILTAGGVIVVRASSASGQLVVGSLTALGSAFSAYLGATFLRSYSRALEQMNYYFGQPLVNSYLLTAERLAKELKVEDSRDQALKEVIDRTLEGAAQAFGAIAPQSQQVKRRNDRVETTGTRDAQ